MEESLTLAVQPKMIVTSNDLRSYSPERRKCYFTNERRLRFYSQYTQSNCELNCKIELTLKNCGCLAINIESKN
jgi:acid-sensing ion channel, other